MCASAPARWPGRADERFRRFFVALAEEGGVLRRAALKTAFGEVLPMLRAHGIMGMIEPLGFEICLLRSKAMGGADTLKLVHDTFHNHLVGGGAIFPDHTGIVHVSGVTDTSVAVSDLRDGHRVLVDAVDRLGNVGQIRALGASMQFITARVVAKAA